MLAIFTSVAVTPGAPGFSFAHWVVAAAGAAPPLVDRPDEPGSDDVPCVPEVDDVPVSLVELLSPVVV